MVTDSKTPLRLQALPHSSTSQNNCAPDVTAVEYPLPQPVGFPAPGWHFSNQRGFVYQAACVHRCLAAGLTQCPQYTKQDSLHVTAILDRARGGGGGGD